MEKTRIMKIMFILSVYYSAKEFTVSLFLMKIYTEWYWQDKPDRESCYYFIKMMRRCQILVVILINIILIGYDVFNLAFDRTPIVR